MISWADDWLNLYRAYADALQTHGHLTLLKYEEMVLDDSSRRESLERAWGLEIDPGLRGGLINEANFDVEKEAVHSHKRQVNDLFGPVLQTLDYPLDPAYRRAAA